jgi:hypothetical protein
LPARDEVSIVGEPVEAVIVAFSISAGVHSSGMQDNHLFSS